MKAFKSSLATIDLAGVGIIVLGALATYYLGLAPAQRAAAAECADRETLAASKTELDAANLQLSSATASLASIRSRVEASSTVLKPASDLFERIQSITLNAQSHSLRVSEINPSALVTGKRFNRIPIHLSGVGTYADFSAFLRELHTSNPDLQVVSFKLLGRAEDAKNAPHFEAQLNLYTSAGAVKPNAAAGSGKDGGGASDGGAAGNGPAVTGTPSQPSLPQNP
jgi:Tfp pilus assembly protein PilO